MNNEEFYNAIVNLFNESRFTISDFNRTRIEVRFENYLITIFNFTLISEPPLYRFNVRSRDEIIFNSQRFGSNDELLYNIILFREFDILRL